MRVVPIACLKDNYAYLLLADEDTEGADGQTAVVIDPSEAAPVESALAREGVTLAGIWLTHHHWDHVGGVEALCAARPGLPVLGSAYDLEHARIAHQTRGLRAGDALSFAAHEVTLIEIPGHTLGAIGYVTDGGLFSGDTLFLAGCGRVFEGTMVQMQQSMAKLRALPESTAIYCGHEYTQSNLRFAHSIEPDSEPIAARLRTVSAQRERGVATVPGRLRDDLATNPFLRWDVPAVIAAARARGATSDAPDAVFGALRAAKDNF